MLKNTFCLVNCGLFIVAVFLTLVMQNYSEYLEEYTDLIIALGHDC